MQEDKPDGVDPGDFKHLPDKKRDTDVGEKSVITKQQKSIVSSKLLPKDGHTWHKYGEKILHDNNFSRACYRCALRPHGCHAKKMVDWPVKEGLGMHITYIGDHCHAPIADAEAALAAAELAAAALRASEKETTNEAGGKKLPEAVASTSESPCVDSSLRGRTEAPGRNGGHTDAGGQTAYPRIDISRLPFGSEGSAADDFRSSRGIKLEPHPHPHSSGGLRGSPGSGGGEIPSGRITQGHSIRPPLPPQAGSMPLGATLKNPAATDARQEGQVRRDGSLQITSYHPTPPCASLRQTRWPSGPVQVQSFVSSVPAAFNAVIMHADRDQRLFGFVEQSIPQGMASGQRDSGVDTSRSSSAVFGEHLVRDAQGVGPQAAKVNGNVIHTTIQPCVGGKGLADHRVHRARGDGAQLQGQFVGSKVPPVVMVGRGQRTQPFRHPAGIPGAAQPSRLHSAVIKEEEVPFPVALQRRLGGMNGTPPAAHWRFSNNSTVSSLLAVPLSTSSFLQHAHCGDDELKKQLGISAREGRHSESGAYASVVDANMHHWSSNGLVQQRVGPSGMSATSAATGSSELGSGVYVEGAAAHIQHAAAGVWINPTEMLHQAMSEREKAMQQTQLNFSSPPDEGQVDSDSRNRSGDQLDLNLRL